jgi:hypothetical protein
VFGFPENRFDLSTGDRPNVDRHTVHSISVPLLTHTPGGSSAAPRPPVPPARGAKRESCRGWWSPYPARPRAAQCEAVPGVNASRRRLRPAGGNCLFLLCQLNRSQGIGPRSGNLRSVRSVTPDAQVERSVSPGLTIEMPPGTIVRLKPWCATRREATTARPEPTHAAESGIGGLSRREPVSKIHQCHRHEDRIVAVAYGPRICPQVAADLDRPYELDPSIGWCSAQPRRVVG